MLMENAVDALKMAGAVLMFVMALSVSIVAFGQVRQTADLVLDQTDRESYNIDGDFYYEATATERQVSIETIIPSIYRAYNEQYKIVFEGLTEPIYTYKGQRAQAGESTANGIERYAIDLEFDNDIIVTDDKTTGYNTFLNAIIYGVKDENFSRWYETVNKRVELPRESLYDRLKGKVILEYLGVYYPSETADEPIETSDELNEIDGEIPEENRTEKRIITYKIVS